MTRPGTGLRGNPSVVRWGDRRAVTVQPLSSEPVQQFVDLDLEFPRALIITLIATSAPPMAGLAVTWKLYWGAGAAMVVEQVTVPVSDAAAPIPTVLQRSASKVRLSAIVASTVAGVPRDVVCSAQVGPVT